MAYTDYFQFTSGLTLYGKARPYNATWATGVVAMSENGSTGEYSSSSFVDDTQYGVFIRLGGSPASSDTPIGSIYPTPAGLDASGIRSAVGLASANLDDQLSDVDTALAGIPEPPSESSIVAAINADATQTTARTNAATAATQATTAATQATTAATQSTTAASLSTAIKSRTDLIGTIRSLIRW